MAPEQPSGTQADHRDDLQLVSEVALAAVTASVVLAVGGLFADGSYRAPLLLQVLLAHLTMVALRRGRLNLPLSGLASAVAGVVAISWSQYAETLWVILPFDRTWSTVIDDLNTAATTFSEESVPIPVNPGLVAAMSIAVWVVAYLSDWAAFRARWSFEPLLPSGVFMLVAAGVGYRIGLMAGAVLYISACLLFVLLHRTWGQERMTGFSRRARSSGRRSLLLTGSVLIVGAVGLGAAIGPNLPGADASGILNWQENDEDDGTRVVVSPLVDIRGRLVENSEIEVFQVQTEAGAGAYWRTTALDEFDGIIWRSSYQTDEAAGSLPRTLEDGTETRTVSQEVSISALGQIWLPAAYEPQAIDAGTVPVAHDQRSATLMVDEDFSDSDGLQYVVESAVPRWTAEQLRAASPDDVPSSITDRYLQLPDTFDERVHEEALRVTEGATTPYDQAIALQSFFRDNFDYDIGVELSHDEDAMMEFLFNGDRRGYCEQFAGAYAAMARSLGIPSRLAVGFTHGEEDPNEPGLYRVQAKHAHAWVELYFAEYGWVPFDPTPTRGPVGAEDWLGIGPQQADQEQPAGEQVDPIEVPEPAEGQPDAPEDTTGGASEGTGPEAPAPQTEGPGEADDDEGGAWAWLPRAIVDVARQAGPFVLAYVILVPSGLALQRHLRRSRAHQPEQQVHLAWTETFELARRLGLHIGTSMTFDEQAAALTATVPPVKTEIDTMARIMERSVYGQRPPADGDVAAVRQSASAIHATIAAERSWLSRVSDHLDARHLLPRSAGRARRAAHAHRPGAPTA